MQRTVKGLVLRTTDIRESDRMLTVYTEEMGIISVLARGARSLKSRNMPSTMQFCYSELTLAERGDKLWVKESSLIESFYGLRDSIEGLALAAYVAEVLDAVATAEGDRELLRLALNTLYAISSGKYGLEKVKAAFEMRLMSQIGFMPDVLACSSCKEQSGDFYFSIMSASVECTRCHMSRERSRQSLTDPHESNVACIISEGARVALCYVIYCPLEKLFSFTVGEDDLGLFSKATELYLLNHLERSFKSLEFYKEVKR